MDPCNVLMCGTGEYTTGYVHGHASTSDKKIGVVALVLFDLRRRGFVDRLGLVGTNGKKLPGIRRHFNDNIAKVYKEMNVDCQTYPDDNDECDPVAYKKAIDSMKKGDCVTIFTPDETHYAIALYAIQKGLHVLLTKPPVKQITEHLHLLKEARKYNVLVCIDYHKRFDPMYRDARERIRLLGDFGYFYCLMTQPKTQLNTFQAWAGRSSDISYYLNSHHIDFHSWSMQGLAVPISVTAMSSTGIAELKFDCPKGTEDTITLMTQWKNTQSGYDGTAVYTASWAAAAKAEVHSQQRFHYMGSEGEIRIDQAHRGYEFTSDLSGLSHLNPLYMKYTPNGLGYFDGQLGYGYQSIEAWLLACQRINHGISSPKDYDSSLPTLTNTFTTTAILEAGRRSLDEHRTITIDGLGNFFDQ